MVRSLYDHLKSVPDYRCSRRKPHELAAMLTCLVCGYVCGRTSVGRALNWCREHLDFLKNHMNLESGVPSEATISRMLKGVDEEMLALTLAEWIAELLNEWGIHIIIDGKALRGATEKVKGGVTPYILNAIDAATGLVLMQLPVDTKTNEITAIPRMLDVLNIKDNTFTIDAIGTQQKIERLILDHGGHYVLQVKKNNLTLYREIISAFEFFEKELNENQNEIDKCSKSFQQYLKKMDVHKTKEKNRGRIEHREMRTCTDPSFLNSVKENNVAEIQTVGYSLQIRIPIEKDAEGEDITVSCDEFIKKGSHRKPKAQCGDGLSDDIQIVGMISDLQLTAKEMAQYKRRHWKIENHLHHVLDDAFREDRSTATVSRNNLSLIRKLAYNLLQLAVMLEQPEWGIQKMMDYYSDRPSEMLEKYVFNEIASLY